MPCDGYGPKPGLLCGSGRLLIAVTISGSDVMTAPVNTITIRGQRHLLTWVSGAAVHLVAEAGAGDEARSIVDGDGGARLNAAYGETELREPCWHLRTVCGCDGWSMCPTDAGPAFERSSYETLSAPVL